MAYEIERKYLIEYPNLQLLEQHYHCQKVEIIQNYLNNGVNGETRRVRKWTENGNTKYIRTEKTKITAMKRIENEWEISKEEYEVTLDERDQNRNSIEKTRYRFLENGLCYEIDLFPFWKDRAFMEVEVEQEDVYIPIPDEIKIIRDVTADARYTNHALASQIPYDEI